MQSTLRATLTLSIKRIVATSRSAHQSEHSRQIFSREPRRVRGRDCSHRITLDPVSSGGLRIATKHDPRHHRSHPRSAAAWIIALHRFLEVSVGIIVGLARFCPVARTSTERGEKRARLMLRSDPCVDGKALSSSKSCRPAFKRGMTKRATTEKSSARMASAARRTSQRFRSQYGHLRSLEVIQLRASA